MSRHVYLQICTSIYEPVNLWVFRPPDPYILNLKS